ncbi:hypothetical protein GLOIN_2v462840 [Rhizophagus irregularis DAOM 181602=DAOM 197198]|nr:hypothetical protein GLOIN_2v462840 [Rhizophagus irregularis DAOM 181602=DAOM 197198]
MNNSYILLGNSYLSRTSYYGYINYSNCTAAIENYNNALKNDPNNYLCLKNCAYAYEMGEDYLNPLNSSAYYLKSLTYYTKNDSNNAKISFKKYAELLNSDNILAKIQLLHLEYLLNKNSSKDLNDILTKIDQIHYSSINEKVFLRFIKCKIYIELKEYSKARLILDCTPYYDGFESMKREVYFVSNLTNLNSELCQFQESDISSLSGLVLSSKNEKLHLVLPILNFIYTYDYFICKMNVKKILSKDCFIKFTLNGNYRDYMLKHEDVSKLEGLGWIEYQTSIRDLHYDGQFSIEIEINSIEMQIEYIRLSYSSQPIITHFTNISSMGYLFPVYHKFFSNVPETFKDKYFSRKEMENLLDLKDILN